MSWQSDDGRHEGYAAHITMDGREAIATTYAGRIMSWSREHLGAGEVQGWDQLLGWEARCTCGWVGPMWRRPADADLQDAGEFDAGASFDHLTAEDVIGDLWRAHVDVKSQPGAGGFPRSD